MAERLDVNEYLRFLAMEIAPRETLIPWLKLVAAIGACLDDDLDLAERLLHETPEDSLVKGQEPLRAFAVAFVEVLREPPGKSAMTGDRLHAITDVMQRPNSKMTLRLVKEARWKISLHSKTRLPELKAVAAPTGPTAGWKSSFWWIIWIIWVLGQLAGLAGKH